MYRRTVSHWGKEATPKEMLLRVCLEVSEHDSSSRAARAVPLELGGLDELEAYAVEEVESEQEAGDDWPEREEEYQ